MQPLTETTPKPLIRILNVPVLKHIMEAVIKAGIRDIRLSLGYKAMEIMEYCEKKQFPADIRYYEETKPLGTAGGVKNCVTETDADVLVLSGDNIFNIDLRAVVEYHRKTNAEVTLVGKEVDNPREYGVIKCDRENRVIGFQEKPTWEIAETCLVNTGIYVMKGRILNLIPSDAEYDFAGQVFPDVLNRKMRFMCCRTELMWGDIGEFDAYRSLSHEMLEKYRDQFSYVGTLYKEDVEDERGNRILAPCLIGEDCTFEENCTVGPYAVLGRGVSVGGGGTVRGCLVGDRVEIGNNTDIIDAILDDDVQVGPNCVVERNSVLGYGVKIGRFSRVLPGYRIWPGRSISPENIISKDMFFETPEGIDADIYGVSGKAYAEFSLSDALKLGQAIASVKKIRRVGVGCDTKEISELYKNVCMCGLRACGAICYDYETVYKAQSYYYSAYSDLDMFLYISTADQTVNISFFGKGGFSVDPSVARAVNNNYRFSAFRFTSEQSYVEIFRMHLLRASYQSALKKMMPASLAGIRIRVECENKIISSLLEGLFHSLGASKEQGGIQILLNDDGTEMYCIEKDHVYSGDRIRSVLCELAFARDSVVILPEDAPDFLLEKARVYNSRAIRMTYAANLPERCGEAFIDNLWNFDAVFLCAKVIGVITEAHTDLEHLMSLQSDFVLRKKIITLDRSPAVIRRMILKAGGRKKDSEDVYYSFSGRRDADVKVRQLGNTNRLRVVIQASDTEAAKEISADLIAKLKSIHIDNNSK